MACVVEVIHSHNTVVEKERSRRPRQVRSIHTPPNTSYIFSSIHQLP